MVGKESPAAALAAAHRLATRATEAATEFSSLRASAEEAQRIFESKEASWKARMQVVEEQRDDLQKQFRDYQIEVDQRMKATQERNDDHVRRITEERVRMETQLAAARSEIERLKIELEQKATQLEIMGQTLSTAASEAKKSVAHVETLQLSLNQCARDKQEWLQERSKLMGDIQTKEFSLTESEAQRSLERSNWQQERERMTNDIDNLHKQMKQRMSVCADQQNTIEHFRRMETQWNLEKASLEQAEANVRAQLAQTEDDLGRQLQAQEKSIQHAKEALGATESSLNSRLLTLEKELNTSNAATMAQEREVARLQRDLHDREHQLQQLRSALEARREAEMRLEQQLATERQQRDQLYRSHQEMQAKTELRHSQALSQLQEEIDKSRHEWEVERHRIYTRMEEERLTWDRKEAEYISNLEKAEREAEAAASSLQEICASADRRMRTSYVSSPTTVTASVSRPYVPDPDPRYKLFSASSPTEQKPSVSSPPVKDYTSPVTTTRQSPDIGTAERHRMALERELVRVREMNRAFEQSIAGSLTPPRGTSPSPGPRASSPTTASKSAKKEEEGTSDE